MASIESYLDRICARLSTNPAVAEDVRRELWAHLEDLVEHYCAQGMTRPEAAERAIAWLGEAERVRTGLGTVFRGDAEWVRRLKAAAAGGLLGVALSLALPVSGHGTVWGAVIGLSCGVCIGLLSDSRPRLLAGSAIGSLAWFAAGIAAAAGASHPSAELPPQTASVLLASVLFGGLFGSAIAACVASLLRVLSRAPRPTP
jgi:hypothetical protein